MSTAELASSSPELTSSFTEYVPSYLTTECADIVQNEAQNLNINEENMIKEKNDKRKNVRVRQRDFCFFCEEHVLNFARHIFRNHQPEIEVQRILALPVKSKERKNLITVLRNKGNHLINNANECIKPVKKSHTEKFLPCTFCLGYYSSKYLWRHRKTCCMNFKKTGENNAQSAAQNLLTQNVEVNVKLRELVFPRMRPDHISLTVKKDILICEYGSRYLKTHREKHFINVTSRKMRELAKLLIEIKKINSSIKCLFDALQPKHFDTIVKAAKIVARFDEEKEFFSSPTYAMNISTSLKQCCEIALLFCIKKKMLFCSLPTNEVENNLRTLISLLKSHWKFDVSSQAANDLNCKKWNKITIVPLASDLKLLKDFLTVQSTNAVEKLMENDKNVEAFNILLETIYCRIILLNRKRPGELQRILVHVYERVINDTTKNYEEFKEAVSQTEQILLKIFKRIVIRGKRGRGVPVLLSVDVQRDIESLLKYRLNFVPKTNPYLFGKPNLNTPLCGYKVLTKYAKACGAKNPEAITCTRLRKHLATISQILNMSNSDIEQLATFMGHTSDVHRKAYRLPDDVYQTAKLSKLLLLMEKGTMAEHKGKSIDEIDLNLETNIMSEVEEEEGDDERVDEYCTEENTQEHNEQNVNEIKVIKKKDILYLGRNNKNY